jgi:hypothetical protein
MKLFHSKYLVVVALLCLTAAGSFYVVSEHIKRGELEAAKQKLAHIEEVKHKLAALQEEYSRKQSIRAAVTRQRVQVILFSAASRSGALSENAALPFIGAKNVMWCVYARAAEIAFKKTDLLDRIRNAMQPTETFLNSTRDKILAELEKFRIESMAAGNELRLRTLKLSDEAGIPPPSLPEISLHAADADIHEVAALNAIAAINTAFEIVLIQDTLAAIVVVVGVMAERQALLFLSAATTWEVPGLNLIVSVAVIGGTVWSATEIYAAVIRQQALPGVIKGNIDAQLGLMTAASLKFIKTIEANTKFPASVKNQ